MKRLVVGVAGRGVVGIDNVTDPPLELCNESELGVNWQDAPDGNPAHDRLMVEL